MSEDPEKNVLAASTVVDANVAAGRWSRLLQRWRAFEARMTKYNLEPRGIQRVLPEESHSIEKLGYLQIIIFWFSANLAANNLTLGMLGPAVYYLPFTDACLCGVFGALAGSIGAAYIASFGPRSGHRGMIFARYILGWWPGKLAVVLALVNLLGYCIINAVIAGQILSGVPTPGFLPIIIGIAIVAVICWFISTFGYSVFHLWERYAWIPQLIAYSIVAGVAGPQFSLTTNPDPTQSPTTLSGNRLSFFSLCFSAAITYSSNSPDYFVYYPPTTSRPKFILSVLAGLVPSFSMTFILGIGLASALQTNPIYSQSYTTDSQGALLTTALSPLGSFGSFIAVIITLGLISNLIPTTYSAGLNLQVLAPPIPRVILNTVAVIIWFICAFFGRERLAVIFTNFLALVGYWFSIYVALVVEEEVFFHYLVGRKWDWEGWEDKSRLPLGTAALVAFLIGYVGAVLCMTQVWYIGPIAKAAFGEYGGDLGNYVGMVVTAVVYPPLRYFEMKRFGR